MTPIPNGLPPFSDGKRAYCLSVISGTVLALLVAGYGCTNTRKARATEHVVDESKVAPKPSSPTIIPSEAALARKVRLRDHALQLILPDALNWQVQHADSWWHVQHPASRSTLELKRWSQGVLVDAADCEAQARLWKASLVTPRNNEIVSRTEVKAPPGYQSFLTVAVTPNEQGVSGYMSVFGAKMRSCFALQFKTHSSDEGASDVIGANLRTISSQVVPSLEELNIEQRVRREALP